MQPVVPLAFEFQINGRVLMSDLEDGLIQSNLSVTTDVFNIDGGSQSIDSLDDTLLAALNTAIKNMVIDNQEVPVSIG